MDELRKRQKIISQLVEARLEQGISQAELARRLGIQRSGINRLESGTQNPTLDMILKIASALGKDVSLELNDKEEPMSHVYSLRIYDTELMRFSMEKIAGRAKIVFGSGANSTQKAVEASKKAEAMGADGLLVVTPYYNKT